MFSFFLFSFLKHGNNQLRCELWKKVSCRQVIYCEKSRDMTQLKKARKPAKVITYGIKLLHFYFFFKKKFYCITATYTYRPHRLHWSCLEARLLLDFDQAISSQFPILLLWLFHHRLCRTMKMLPIIIIIMMMMMMMKIEIKKKIIHYF